MKSSETEGFTALLVGRFTLVNHQSSEVAFTKSSWTCGKSLGSLQGNKNEFLPFKLSRCAQSAF